MNDPGALLAVNGLRIRFNGRGGGVRAVDDLSLTVFPSETVAIVGESGCGKSATALSILRLINAPTGEIDGGEILFEGTDLLGLDEEQMRGVRGRKIAMIFQEPMSSLNPVLTVERQLIETLTLHGGMSRGEARKRAIEVLRLVRLPDPEAQLPKYPHELSGGMRQRVMIAMALMHHPRLLIADEPTTALDVTIQAQVLDLMSSVRDETGTAILLITHDLGVVAEMANRVIVMYAGRKVEEAVTAELFANPRHPYTRGLMAAGPRLGSSVDDSRTRLTEIPGTVPIMRDDMQGCPFAVRCANALPRCSQERPQLLEMGPGHLAACFNTEARPL